MAAYHRLHVDAVKDPHDDVFHYYVPDLSIEVAKYRLQDEFDYFDLK